MASEARKTYLSSYYTQKTASVPYVTLAAAVISWRAVGVVLQLPYMAVTRRSILLEMSPA